MTQTVETFYSLLTLVANEIIQLQSEQCGTHTISQDWPDLTSQREAIDQCLVFALVDIVS